jgi:hypothetical protein
VSGTGRREREGERQQAWNESGRVSHRRTI